MKRTLLALLLMPSMVGGCHSVQQVELDHADHWMAGAQSDLLARQVTVTTTDGATAEGTIVEMNPDSLVMRREHDGNPYAYPLNSIRSVRPSNAAGPIVGGIVGGGLLGGVIGGMVAAEEEEPDPAVWGVNTTVASAAGVAVGALVGAAVGGVGLGLATAVTEYRFLPGNPSRTGSKGAHDLMTLEVTSLIEETGSHVRFKWGGNTFTLPTEGVKIRRIGDNIYITASKTLFLQAGIQIE